MNNVDLIIIGAGHLGQALSGYNNFFNRGFIFKGAFDLNKDLHGKKIRDIEIRPVEEIEQFVRDNKIEIAVLTIPKDQAVPMAEKLVNCGIKAIWNFAHVDLDVPENVQVENVHLSDSLMKLSYSIDRYEKTHKKKK